MHGAVTRCGSDTQCQDSKGKLRLLPVVQWLEMQGSVSWVHLLSLTFDLRTSWEDDLTIVRPQAVHLQLQHLRELSGRFECLHVLSQVVTTTELPKWI